MRRSFTATALAVVATLLPVPGIAYAEAACAPSAGGGEWRSYGGDLTNSRSQPAEDTIGVGSAYDLEPSWAASVAGAGGVGGFQSTPTIADGCVFVGSSGGTVMAFNADTGDLVWKTDSDGGGLIGGIFAVAVPGDGRVYATVGTPAGLVGMALDQTTGAVLWQTETLDTIPGTITNSSAVVFDGLYLLAWSGPDADPQAHPGFAVIDAPSGTVLKKTLVIPDDEYADGFGGGGIWATAAIDADTKYAFAGTANPDSKEKEHRYANAILKIDLDRTRPTFGEIVDAYKGNFDNYYPTAYSQPVCQTVGPLEPSYALTCLQLDIDFGGSGTLFRDDFGHLLFGELQKSGVFHAVYADTMQLAWTALLSPPSALGNASSAAWDGTNVYVPANPGVLYALDPNTGGIRWAAPTAGGAHYQPPSVANGVVYLISTDGALHTYDAVTGQPLFVRPLALDAADPCTSLGGGVAIARNRVFATCDTGVAGGGWVVSYSFDGDAPLPALPIPY